MTLPARARAIVAVSAVLATCLFAVPVEVASARSAAEPTIRAPAFVYQDGRYHAFQHPRSETHTYANGINDRGQIAGGLDSPSVDGPNGRIHALVWRRNSQQRRFDAPGAMGTLANKINDRGQVIGAFNRQTASVGSAGTLGFLLDRRGFTRINVPGALETQPLGINNRGVVVGEYLDTNGVFHGFRWHRGRLRTIDGPGSRGAIVADINDRGQMVGTYFADDGTARGFVLDNGSYATFQFPDAGVTLALDINNRGQIAGTGANYDANGNPTFMRGFVLRRGTRRPFTAIDVPGALGTIARGIDDRGRVVGIYATADANPVAGSAHSQSVVELLAAEQLTMSGLLLSEGR
jgi:uncharacterized membrane protein